MRAGTMAFCCGVGLAMATLAVADSSISGSDFTLRFSAVGQRGRGKDIVEMVMGDADDHETEAEGVERFGGHRIFIDTRRGLYYGYHVAVTKSDTPSGFRITLGPLSAGTEKTLRTATWSHICPGCPAPRPVSSEPQRYPPPQILQSGDKVTVDLLTDARTAEVVSDEITLLGPDAPAQTQPAQDFAVDKVEFQFVKPQLLVDGQPIGSDGGAVAGTFVWLALPGQGRVFFGLVPRPGYPFQKIGVVEGNKLRFTLAGHHYEWVSQSPVVTPASAPRLLSAQSWNVWVLHDAGYLSDRPGSNGAGFDSQRLKKLKKP